MYTGSVTSDSRKSKFGQRIRIAVLCVAPLWIGSCWYDGFPLHPRNTLFLRAVGASDYATVNAILATGYDPNTMPDDLWTNLSESWESPMCIAAGNGDLKMLKLLLDHHASPELGDGWNGAPLTVAALKERVDVMQLLIDRGARVNYDDSGSYSLWWAAREVKLKSVAFLLAHGANPNSTLDLGKNKQTLLSSLKERGSSPRVVQMLIAAGAHE